MRAALARVVAEALMEGAENGRVLQLAQAQLLADPSTHPLGPSLQRAIDAALLVACPPHPFSVGQRVHKARGKYQAHGRVHAAYLAPDGEPMVVFEFEAVPGVCHLFSASQLDPAA